ncbi:MAG: polyphosphate kinase 2 family protein [Thermoleophilia bacterium]
MASLIQTVRVAAGKPAGLAKRDPHDDLGLAKDEAEQRVADAIAELAPLQNRLWAESTRAVLVVLQGMDAAGKDGTIRRIFTGLNPQGCRVASFKAPTPTELDHDYLWRVHAVCPARGEIGIFNRSHYEDVAVVRVHELVPEATWRRRFRHIREFERTLAEEGTAIVKIFLHISKEEQRERLQARLDDPEKRWKFRLGDLDDRKRWDDYQAAYEEAISETSTEWAPWHVVPADRKWVRDVVVSHLLVDTLKGLDPRLPEPAEDLTGVVVE